MKKLVVNADDFGYCEAANYGIIKAFQKGIVTSTTLMANMPAVKHAYQLYQENPTLHVGVHLTLSCYKPLLKTHKTLVDENGYFTRKYKTYDLDEVYEELCAQIEYAKEIGFAIEHLDSHHHIHTEEVFKTVIDRILDNYNLPIRGGFTYAQEYDKKTILIDAFYDKGVSIKNFEKIVKGLEEDKVYDLMCHPSYLEKFLYDSSSYAVPRMNELEILCSEEVKKIIKENRVSLTNYKNEFFIL